MAAAAPPGLCRWEALVVDSRCEEELMASIFGSFWPIAMEHRIGVESPWNCWLEIAVEDDVDEAI